MIAVIGANGIVGSAVASGLETKFKILRIDRKSQKAHWDKVKTCDYTFICVPTPSNKDGSVDFSIVDKVLPKCGGIIIIKSTIPPGTTQGYIKKYPGMKIVCCPEFLTEANAKDDFLHPNRVIIGANDPEIADKVEFIYLSIIPNLTVIVTTPTEAELIKYLSNSFLSLKVLFANEGKYICDTLGANWETVSFGIGLDKRIGQNHLSVTKEGGFGGMCFPKDTQGLAFLLNKYQIRTDIIGKLWEINKRWRKYE